LTVLLRVYVACSLFLTSAQESEMLGILVQRRQTQAEVCPGELDAIVFLAVRGRSLMRLHDWYGSCLLDTLSCLSFGNSGRRSDSIMTIEWSVQSMHRYVRPHLRW
jgi:hypothetical protein